LASESKQSVENQTAEVDEQQQQATAQPDGEDSGRKRKQTVVSQAADVDKQQQQAADRTDGEDVQRWQARASDQ